MNASDPGRSASSVDQLLLHLLGPSPDPADVRALLGSIPSPRALVERAIQAGVGPPVAHVLEDLGHPGLPPEVVASLEEIRHRAVGEAIRWAEEGADAVSRLESAGVEAVLHKGPGLAVRARGRATIRGTCDVDVLCRPEDVETAIRTLAGVGLRPDRPASPSLFRTNHALNLRPGPDGPARLPVDLHWRLHPATWDALPAADLIEAAEPLAVLGRELPVPAGPLVTLETCLRAVRDAFAPKPLLDLAGLARAGTDWERVRAEAAARRILGPVAAACDAARRLLAAPAPPPEAFGSVGRARARQGRRAVGPGDLLEGDAVRYWPLARELLVAPVADDPTALPRALGRLVLPPAWAVRRPYRGPGGRDPTVGETLVAYARRPLRLVRRGAEWVALAFSASVDRRDAA